MYVNQVHAGCLASVSKACSLGQCRVSMLPPTAITSLDSDGFWRATRPPGTSPLLVFLNSKSGDSQVTNSSYTLPAKQDTVHELVKGRKSVY